MKLDLSSFKKAIHQLEKSLIFCNSDLAKHDREMFLQFRLAAIQALEFTYELSWRMLKRYLEMTEPNPSEIDGLSFSNLIRLSNEKGLLLSDLKKWVVYQSNRNITSHTYDDDKAEQVFLHLPEFLKEAQYLHDQLRKRSQ